MGNLDLRLAAFIEYVARPLSEDWKQILQQVKELNLPLSERFLTRSVMALGLWHLAGEALRAGVYLAITWTVCVTVMRVLPCHP